LYGIFVCNHPSFYRFFMKYLISVLLVLSCIILPLNAQENDCSGMGAWLPVGEGVQDLSPVWAVEMNGNLCVGSHSEEREVWVVSRWSGTVWQEIATLPDYHVWMKSAIVYRDKLYVYCTFSADNGTGTDSSGLLEWDGTEWKQLLTLTNGDVIRAMVVYHDQLIVAGRFSYTDGSATAIIVAWNGEEWNRFGGPTPVDEHDESALVTSLAVSDDILYVGGLFRLWSPWGILPEISIAAWDGGSWDGLSNSSSLIPQMLAIYKGLLYVYATDENNDLVVAQWDGPEWKIVSSPGQIRVMGNMAVYNDGLYITGVMNTWPELGKVHNVVMCYDGEWRKVEELEQPGNGSFLEVVGGVLYAGGPNIHQSCKIPLAGIARFVTDENYGSISGSVFRDNDGNCEPEEQAVTRYIVEAQPGNYFARVRDDGTYSFALPMGWYNVSVHQRDYWQQVCPPDEAYLVKLTESSQHASGVNFGFAAAQNIQKLDVSIAGSPGRPGAIAEYTIRYENVGTKPFTGTVTLEASPLLVYEKSVPELYEHSASTYTWNVENMPVRAVHTAQIFFVTPSDGSLVGTRMCARVEAVPAQNSEFPGELSHDEYCEDIVSSYAPHRMVVSPRGLLPEGVITPDDTVLYYTVHFQNVENDTIFTAIMYDKLPDQVDVGSLRAGVSSHPYELEIIGNNEVQWIFQNIRLPNRTVNEAQSRGYVKYAVQLKKNLPIGTVIRNSAEIYYDYSRSVQTNEVQNVIGEVPTTGIADNQLSVAGLYPNPAHDKVTLVSPLLVPGTVYIYNRLGNVALAVPHTGGERLELSLQQLIPGIYYLQYPTSGGNLYTIFTVVR
jgi:hypothetical protein